MRALLISGKREQTPISLLHLIPFYLPIVATASLEKADAGSRSSIAQARRAPQHAAILARLISQSPLGGFDISIYV